MRHGLLVAVDDNVVLGHGWSTDDGDLRWVEVGGVVQPDWFASSGTAWAAEWVIGQEMGCVEL
jgi:hypothetical protein